MEVTISPVSSNVQLSLLRGNCKKRVEDRPSRPICPQLKKGLVKVEPPAIKMLKIRKSRKGWPWIMGRDGISLSSLERHEPKTVSRDVARQARTVS